MKLQLIKGSYSQAEALEILSGLVQVKIRYHENKIGNSQNEEDIKMRESRIKELQRELAEVKKIVAAGTSVELSSDIFFGMTERASRATG